jgi:hypothetical protein
MPVLHLDVSTSKGPELHLDSDAPRCVYAKRALCCSWMCLVNTSKGPELHCTENLKQIFPEMKLRGLVPNFYINVSVSDLLIPTIGQQMQYSKKGEPIVGI